MTSIFFAMLRREVQEHKVAFIYAPFIVTIVLCFVIASVYFGITDIQTAEFNFSTEIYDEDYQEGMLQASPEAKARVKSWIDGISTSRINNCRLWYSCL